MMSYADDTVIFLSGQNTDVISQKLNSDLHLTIDVKKTKCMYIHLLRKDTCPYPILTSFQTETFRLYPTICP